MNDVWLHGTACLGLPYAYLAFQARSLRLLTWPRFFVYDYSLGFSDYQLNLLLFAYQCSLVVFDYWRSLVFFAYQLSLGFSAYQHRLGQPRARLSLDQVSLEKEGEQLSQMSKPSFGQRSFQNLRISIWNYPFNTIKYFFPF